MISEVTIITSLRNGKTILANAYASQPFKLADITEDWSDKTLHLMLMSSSPGVLDNDRYKIKIELKNGSLVELYTQSYQRLFQMKTGATQEIDVVMEKDSSFIFLPQPCVPQEKSVFSGKNKIYLTEDCFFIWGEVLTCGRKLNGEVFRLSSYHIETEIFLSGKLVVRENLFIAPGFLDINVIGQLEGYTHQASLTCICGREQLTELIDCIRELLSDEKNIAFGVSALSVNGFIVRILGEKAEQLYLMLKLIAYHITPGKAKKELVKTPAYAK